MRKVLSFALAVCLTLLMCVPAFADGRGPAFTTYDVVCTKAAPYYQENWEKDGAWEKKGTFPVGTTLTVDYEYEQDGVLYGNVRIGDGDDMDWVYVRLSDVEMKNDTYLPENAQKLSKPHTVRVIERGGIAMYAGPNKRYAKIATVPRGTKLTYNYGNDGDDYYRTWAYVTYLGKSGWIYVYASDTKNGLAELPDANEKAEIWVLSDDVKMYDGISFGNMENELGDNYGVEVIRENHEEPDRVVGTLEKGKTYSYRYFHAQGYGTWYYVTAGLRAGWVFMADENSRVAVTATETERDQYRTYRIFRVKLREAPVENANGTSVTIAKDTVLTPEYITHRNYDEYYYITTQGQSGWYSRADVWEACAYKVDNTFRGYYDKNESGEAAPIYSDIVARTKTVGNIPAGGLFTPLYYGNYETQIDEENSKWTYFYYVRYNDVTGWVMEEDLWTPDDEAEETETQTEEYPDSDEVWEGDGVWDDTEWIEDNAGEDVDEYDEVTAVPQSGLSALQIVLICVGGAGVLALTAAVTLALIRRKRRNKTAAPAEPEQADTESADETDEPS